MYQEKLTAAGFEVFKNHSEVEACQSILDRHPTLPTDYLAFLKNYKKIVNETDTTWFNLNQEFDESSENEFRWNEFELMSLEWSEDDQEEIAVINQFWNTHLPILLSVENGYQFLAICLEPGKHGEIVHGEEPEFENVKKICSNFDELIDLIGNNRLKDII